ncbi:glycosyltransferase family 4 protein [uncultured Methanofollis sp.]|uniref:glycosyltransferase family 4 protein n=1 Tax=uncultured Methanofollis sp. TaxID=262500 RepID=UPI0026322D85|nr:glycosyltransferase family 4 protein [uncultured Methanofollis sp.]
MKICMLTTVHPPFDTRIYYKEAVSLAKKYDVVVIAPSDEEIDRVVGDVEVKSVKKAKNKIFHLLTLWRIFLAGLKEECDVYHCHELGSLFLGVLFKLVKGTRLVYDVHEHWPSQFLEDIGINDTNIFYNLLERFVLEYERFLSGFSDSILAVSESVAERFRDSGKPLWVILNVPVLQYSLCGDTCNKNPRELIYMGGKLQASHGVQECYDAVTRLKTDYPDIRLTIVGKLDDRLSQVLRGDNSHFNVTGTLPYDKMYKRICEGGIGLVFFQKVTYNMYVGLPNKLFDYMSCGLPVVASDFPEIRRIVGDCKCGILVGGNARYDIYGAIHYLIEHPDRAREMGENGKKAVEERYNWDRMEEMLFKAYSDSILII